MGKLENWTHEKIYEQLDNSWTSDLFSCFKIVKNKEKTIHVQNLQMLMIQVYKSLNHQNPSYRSYLQGKKLITIWELKTFSHYLRHWQHPSAETRHLSGVAYFWTVYLMWSRVEIQYLLLSKALKTGLVKFAIVVFVYNFATLCSC